jgi:DNA-binding GntR family transcriptional regulator
MVDPLEVLKSQVLQNHITNPITAGRGQTAHVYVRECMRAAILNGQLPGGTRLVQNHVAKFLKVSTTPVREALRDLASEGLIIVDAHRGAVVAEFDDDDLREVYQIRQRLEPLMLEFALPQLTDEIIARAEELHEAMCAAPGPATWAQLNREFHMCIYEAADHPRLVSLVRSLQDASVMAVSANLDRLPAVREQANSEHAMLLDAIRRRDLDAAVSVILHHATLSPR